MLLSLSADTKTSPAVRRRPTKMDAVPNAFGTTPGRDGTCGPAATDQCAAFCYVGHKPGRKARRYAAVEALLARNADIVRELATPDGWERLADEQTAMVRESHRRQVRAGVRDPLFRWHWSGEILNEWHARAIARTCRATPEVAHWIYSRNLWVLAEIVGIDNLRVLVSADDDNLAAATAMAQLYGLQVAFAGDRDVAESIGERVLTCPAARRGNVVDTRVSPTGTAGICSACRACVDTVARPTIHFPIH
jgi:hypothetical protein